MLSNMQQIALTTSFRQRLASYMTSRGTVNASKVLGVSRDTLARCVAGLPVRNGTAALVRMRLDEIYPANACDDSIPPVTGKVARVI